MNNTCKQVCLMAALLLGLAACDEDTYQDTPLREDDKQLVFSATGDITATLNKFRAQLGDSLNTTPGKTSGRREVNWDGVPPAFTNNNLFPFDFFGASDPALPDGRKRGLILNTDDKFRISDNDFADIDPSYDAQFDEFSPVRTFVTISSNVTEVRFKVPGTDQDAHVKGFGVVFSDVDLASSTTVEFCNGKESLGIFPVKARTDDNGISFLGVFFPDGQVSLVKIRSGDAKLEAGVTDGPYKDLVVMDDFLYSEPLAAK